MSSGSVIPTHIADWADIILPLGHWNGSDGWSPDAGGELCVGNASTEAAAGVAHATPNVYVRRRVFINVYLVVGLCAFGFVGNALTVAVLRRDKVNMIGLSIYYLSLKERSALNGNPHQSYGASPAMIWDHTVLPATRYK